MSSKNPPQAISADEGVWKTKDYQSVYSPYGFKNEPRYLINHNYISDIFSNLEGKLLTLVEAVTDDQTKREAVKSFIRQVVWAEFRKISLLRLIKQE